MYIQLLGRVAVVDHGRSSTVPRAQARGVLALLALNAGRMVSLDQVATAMWGGAEPATARTQIYSAISSVRRLLATAGGGATVVGGRFGYQLTVAESDVDALRFERLVQRHGRDDAYPETGAARLREALRLWRGEPLADAAGAFVDGARAQLVQRRLNAIDDLATLDLASGRFADVAAELAAVVAEHPSHERLRGRLMIALFRCGRQTESLRLYHDYRRSLAEGEGLDPGAELAAVADAVLRDTLPPVAVPARERVGSDVAATSFVAPATPNLLPPHVPDFVGRTAELAAIAVAVRPQRVGFAPAIVTITGLGGLGKTTLAIHAAHRGMADFPNGCLYADLRGWAIRPADPELVLATFLRALGVAHDQVPADPDQRLALYRSLTADRRLLVVLDDARDEAQLRPLLPTGKGCAVLATARSSLAGIDGATPVRLPQLSDVDGAALLSTVAGVDPVNAAAIARLCGGLPLAIRIAGARLAHEQDTDTERLQKNLSDEQARLDQLSVGDRDVRSTLALSYRRLSPAAGALFARLGALPAAEASRWVAGCLLDDPRSAPDALAELVDAALVAVVHRGPEPRYRLHDLVQLYAREQGPGGADDDAPVRRLYQGLAGLATAYDEQIHAGFPTPPRDHRWYQVTEVPVTTDPNAWFAIERDLIVGAIADATARGWTRLAGQLLAAITNLADRSDGPDEWDRLVEAVLPILSGHPGHEYDEATLLLAHAGRLRTREEHDRALPMLRRARRLFRVLDDPARAATSATQLAMIYRRHGQERLASAYFAWAIAQFAVAGHPAQEVQAHVGLGNLWLRQGRHGDAQNAYLRALALIRRHGEATSGLYPNVLGCLAEVAAVEGRYDEALECYHEAMARAAEIGDLRQWAQVQFQIVKLHHRSGNRAAGVQAAHRAAQSLDAVGLTAMAGRARSIAAELSDA